MEGGGGRATGREELGQIKGNKLGDPGEEASSIRNKKAEMGSTSKRSESQSKSASGRVM